jgi:type I restriction enzyme S subunit
VIPGDFALSVGKPDKSAPPGWQWTALSDVARLETGHTPSRRHPEYWGGDVPWIGIKDATENHGRVLADTLQHTNELGIANSSARILPTNTVCLSRTASVGYVVVMGRPMATSQDFVNWVCSDALDHRFLKYVLLAEQSAFLRFASGTTHQTIYFPEVKAFHVCLPPLAEQRAVAEILGTLDDKIELNRRMNETLEAMARALFKSWFVDFDPVRAKAEGRDPGLPKPLADLFPDRLVDSELGEIPEGWDVGPLDSVLVLQRGFDLPATQRTSGPYPVLAASGPSGTHSEFMVRGPGVTTGRSGVLGNVFYVAEDFWPLNTSLWVKEFRHSRPAYAFHLLQGLDFTLFNAGSAVPTLNRNHVHTLSTLLPPVAVIDAFERFATGCLTRQRNNVEQATTLARARDSLLPKLISGQLRVKEA